MKRRDLYRALTIMLIIICCVALPQFASAQPNPPNDTPIDGGLSILLAAGVGYGVKKYREAKKKNAEEENEIK
jgi:hypothetical protein